MIRLITLREWLGKDALPEKKKALKTIKLLFLLALFIGLFLVIPIQDVVGVISSAHPGLLAIGLLLGLPMVYINAYELGLLTRKQGVSIPSLKLFAIHLVVKFYQLFLPGAIIGSGIRWLRISPRGKSIETLAAMAFYRLLDVFTVIAVGVFWFITGTSQVDMNPWTIGLFFMGIAMMWLSLTKGSLRIAKWLEQRSYSGPGRPAFQVIRHYGERMVKSMASYADLTLRELSTLVGAEILSDLVSLISYMFIARSVGIEISIANLGWMRSVFLLASLTPLTFAGGIGIREVSFVIMMSAFDISPEVALAFSLLLFCRTLFLSLTGGFIELAETISSRLKSI